MKRLYGVNSLYLAIALFLCILFLPNQVIAQNDTLVVEWWDDDAEEIIVNALVTAIEEDTERPEGRVYKLLRGGFYANTESIEAPDFHIRIVGEAAGTEEHEHPPILQMYRRDDGSIETRMMTIGSDATLKNLYILGNDDTGDQSSYQPIRITGSGRRQVIDNVIFERSNFALPAWDGANNTIIIKNSVFRNLVPVADNQKWTGRGVSAWTDQDTVIIENNTFFLINFTAVQVEGGAARYFRFNHNTLVNIGRNFITGSWWRDAFVTNNLIINGYWHGEDESDFGPDRDPRATHAGMMGVGALPSEYGPEIGRRIVFANNATWRDPIFNDFYADDNIVPARFIAPQVREDYFDVYEGMVVQDTVWLPQRPNTPTYFDQELFDAMWDYITNVRTTPAQAEPYFWMLPEHPITGDILHTGVRWPLPEDFSYDDAQLLTAGTDGLPLGDLNWFPDEKQDFLANMNQYIEDIHDMAGPQIVFNVADSRQAHLATLLDPAEVEIVTPSEEPPAGDPAYWFHMDGGIYFQWDFELDQGGEYDLNVLTHMRGNGMRGQRVIVNGVSIRDERGWGEYIWDTNEGPHAGMPINEWTWTLIRHDEVYIYDDNDDLVPYTLTLNEGSNTIRIEASWGWQNFADIEILPAGSTDPAVVLSPIDITSYSVVEPRTYGLEYTPEYFRFVNLGETGTATWNLNAPGDGTYLFRVFYQNTGGPVAGNLAVDGMDVQVDFDSDPEGGALDVTTDVFSLSTGTHDFTLSGSGVKVDNVQLIEKTVVSVPPVNIVDGFHLYQNYPNPFNPSTTIRYTIPQSDNVVLSIYNILGQRVATLVNEVQVQGTYNVTFDASHLSSGIYFYRITAGDYVEVKKMMFLK